LVNLGNHNVPITITKQIIVSDPLAPQFRDDILVEDHLDSLSFLVYPHSIGIFPQIDSRGFNLLFLVLQVVGSLSSLNGRLGGESGRRGVQP